MVGLHAHGSFAVARDDRLEKLAMFDTRVGFTIGSAGVRLKQSRQVVEAMHLGKKNRVGTSRNDSQVKVAMVLMKLRNVGRLQRRRKSRFDRNNEVGIAVGKFDRLADRYWFEQESHRIQFGGFVRIETRHAGPPLRSQRQQTFARQSSHRFANRSWRNSPTVGQSFDLDSIARRQFTRQNFGSQQIVGPLGPSRRNRIRSLGHDPTLKPVNPQVNNL